MDAAESKVQEQWAWKDIEDETQSPRGVDDLS